MKENHLHIISLDIPYPDNYGGVIDIYYKIIALYNLGVKIHLHCFTKNRTPQLKLNEYCETVKYYNRNSFAQNILLQKPFIVASRNNTELINNLLKNEYPIFIEGVHCSIILQNKLFTNRKILVRLHNVEHIYYNKLSTFESNIFKKIYYKIESALLKKYEKFIATQNNLLAISDQDVSFFQSNFNAQHIQLLPAFIPFQTVESLIGTGKYCLYHGNLAINENEKAALWLINNVFIHLNIPLVISGNNPSLKLIKTAKKYKHISIVNTPINENLQLLIKNAQINVLPSFNNTGIKLKLLNALYNGRFCLVNNAAIEGSSMHPYCSIANSASEFVDQINNLFQTYFTQTQMQHRSAALNNVYNNQKNAQQIINLIY